VRKLQAFPRTKGAIKEVEKISDRLKRVDIYFAIGYNIRNQRPAYSAGENGGRFMFEKVCNMLAEQLGISADTITPASEVVKDLGADSLDVVELMMALEDEYGVTLPEGEVENLKTVQDIVSMLEKLQK
jgi:acyl carrier protein